MADYRSPVKDALFTLRHIGMLEELSKTERYSHADPETVASVLEEQGRFMQEVFAPTNAIGDREGLVWSPEGVPCPEAFRSAYAKFVDAGGLLPGDKVEVAGLGANPGDVTINGAIEVYNRCLDNGTANCLALVNFWRTLSNLTLNVDKAGQDGCRSSANFWAVSQAVSMRRLHVTGNTLSLMDYCTAGPQ